MAAVPVTAPHAALSEAIREDTFAIMANGATDGGSGGVDPIAGIGDISAAYQKQTKDFLECAALGIIRGLAPVKQILQLFNNSDGSGDPASKTTGAFTTTAGSKLLVMVSGSGSHATGSTVVGMTVKLDATTLGICQVYTKEATSNKAFVTQFLLATPAAGSHTIVLEKLSGTVWDSNDFMNVTIAEVLF